ncbi:hypothetical protein D3C84_786340 [compost metagenome]
MIRGTGSGTGRRNLCSLSVAIDSRKAPKEMGWIIPSERFSPLMSSLPAAVSIAEARSSTCMGWINGAGSKTGMAGTLRTNDDRTPKSPRSWPP